MQFDTIEVRKEGKIATIVLNRPAVMNAISSQTLEELAQAVDSIDSDDQIVAAIITGAGEKAFSAGADIRELKGQTLSDHEKFIALGNRVFGMLEESGKVFIAAVRGYALGGGCELIQACDLRVASDDAKFGQPEVKVGGFPGWGGTQRLPRLVGKTKATEMIFTGNMIDAREALRIGLVNRVVPAQDLLKEAYALAMEIAQNRPEAVRLAKAAINHGFRLDIEHEAALNNLNFAGKDRKEGLSAFLAKKGRSVDGDEEKAE
ncbi:MAG: enoyl-CoA hydratase-related protein [Firmicutes bacterium]|jgi:enoyl-CoA hydratase|nr:enoyl-CoA hydratase-related protein [Bacillota bacterium]